MRDIAVLAIVLVLSGCGSSGVEQVADVDEVLVRTAAGTQGQNELAKVGVQLTGLLSCDTDQVDDGVSVACSGTTVDGQAVELSGTATSLPGGMQFRETLWEWSPVSKSSPPSVWDAPER